MREIKQDRAMGGKIYPISKITVNFAKNLVHFQQFIKMNHEDFKEILNNEFKSFTSSCKNLRKEKKAEILFSSFLLEKKIEKLLNRDKNSEQRMGKHEEEINIKVGTLNNIPMKFIEYEHLLIMFFDTRVF